MTDWSDLIDNILAGDLAAYSSADEDAEGHLSPIKKEDLTPFMEGNCSALYTTSRASDGEFFGISPHNIFDSFESSGPQSYSSARALTRSYSNNKHAFEGSSRDSTFRSPDFSMDGAANSPKKEGTKRSGRKKGSNIQCDEHLIMRLLPLSTKRFNQEIKNLSLGDEEIKKLKFARRRIKNARAAQKRRSKLSENLDELRHRVHTLTQENLHLNMRLQAVIDENTHLKRERRHDYQGTDQFPQLR